MSAPGGVAREVLVLHSSAEGYGSDAGFGPLWPAWRAVIARTGEIACISPPSPRSSRARRACSRRVERLPAPSREEARRALALDPGARVVLLPGRLSGWQGQDVLLRALPGRAPSDIRPGQTRFLTSIGDWPEIRYAKLRPRAPAAYVRPLTATAPAKSARPITTEAA